MSWSSLKNIMLSILVIINLFLIVTAVVLEKRDVKVDETVIDSACEILNESEFTVDKSIIDEKYPKLTPIFGKFLSHAELSKMFFKEEVPFWASDDSAIAQKDGKTLTVNDDRFIFKTDKEQKTASVSEVKKALKKIGFDMSSAEGEEDNGYVTFRLYYEKKQIFGAYLTAGLDENKKLSYVEGIWPEIRRNGASYYGEHIFSFVPSFKDFFYEGSKIVGIEVGYMIPSTFDYEGYKPLSAVWQVTTDSGQEHYFTAGEK